MEVCLHWVVPLQRQPDATVQRETAPSDVAAQQAEHGEAILSIEARLAELA